MNGVKILKTRNAKDCQKTPKLEHQGRILPQSYQRDRGPTNTQYQTSVFQNDEQNISVVLSFPVFDYLLQQPQGINAGALAGDQVKDEASFDQNENSNGAEKLFLISRILTDS